MHNYTKANSSLLKPFSNLKNLNSSSEVVIFLISFNNNTIYCYKGYEILSSSNQNGDNSPFIDYYYSKPEKQHSNVLDPSKNTNNFNINPKNEDQLTINDEFELYSDFKTNTKLIKLRILALLSNSSDNNPNPGNFPHLKIKKTVSTSEHTYQSNLLKKSIISRSFIADSPLSFSDVKSPSVINEEALLKKMSSFDNYADFFTNDEFNTVEKKKIESFDSRYTFENNLNNISHLNNKSENYENFNYNLKNLENNQNYIYQLPKKPENLENYIKNNSKLENSNKNPLKIESILKANQPPQKFENNIKNIPNFNQKPQLEDYINQITNSNKKSQELEAYLNNSNSNQYTPSIDNHVSKMVNSNQKQQDLENYLNKINSNNKSHNFENYLNNLDSNHKQNMNNSNSNQRLPDFESYLNSFPSNQKHQIADNDSNNLSNLSNKIHVENNKNKFQNFESNLSQTNRFDRSFDNYNINEYNNKESFLSFIEQTPKKVIDQSLNNSELKSENREEAESFREKSVHELKDIKTQMKTLETNLNSILDKLNHQIVNSKLSLSQSQNFLDKRIETPLKAVVEKKVILVQKRKESLKPCESPLKARINPETQGLSRKISNFCKNLIEETNVSKKPDQKNKSFLSNDFGILNNFKEYEKKLYELDAGNSSSITQNHVNINIQNHFDVITKDVMNRSTENYKYLNRNNEGFNKSNVLAESATLVRGRNAGNEKNSQTKVIEQKKRSNYLIF